MGERLEVVGGKVRGRGGELPTTVMLLWNRMSVKKKKQKNKH